MSVKSKTAISPTREEDYPEWYQQVVRAAQLAEIAPVRGCMVIKPWGYALWENTQKILNTRILESGHDNAYFPLFIPVSYFEREAKHVEGFAKECAVVTHSRLKHSEGGGLEPASPLEEPLVVRPTSELMIGEMFSKWVQSYRDLPLKINQWCNIVRWEMRTRLFLRTTEFLWQEGHTVHATKEEAMQEAKDILTMYVDVVRGSLAIPVIYGEKTESERFPGADATFTLEAMMQDKKALQGGTSHFLGQNFAKACNITFMDEAGQEAYGWMTSWGITTRLIGALVMTHGDDDGLVVPPRIAPKHVVILPVILKEETKQKVMDYCESLQKRLREQTFNGECVRTELDARDLRGGDKRWEWIKKGVPIIVEVGPRDIDNNAVFVTHRDLGPKAIGSLACDTFVNTLGQTLQAIQDRMYEKAKRFRDDNIVEINNKDDFYAFFTPKNPDQPEIHGGFALAHWNGSPEVEEQLQRELKVTIRCIPHEFGQELGTCFMTGEPSKQRVVFAKAY